MALTGSGYLGSSQIETSTAMQELVPNPPAHYSMGYEIYKLSFLNYEATRIIINGDTELFLSAKSGFEMNERDKPIVSLVIVDADIPYEWRAGY